MTDDLVIARRARHRINQAIRSGRVSRPNHCEKCGAEDKRMRDGRTSIQAHHHNGYEDALDVEWLCVTCHNRVTPLPYGERAGPAKVGWDRVNEIRARYRAGESYYRIADELGFAPSTVHRIVTHRTWPEHARPADQEKRHG